MTFIQLFRMLVCIQIGFVCFALFRNMTYIWCIAELRGFRKSIEPLPLVSVSYAGFMVFAAIEVFLRISGPDSAGVPWRAMIAFFCASLGNIALVWFGRILRSEYNALNCGS